MEEIRIDSIDDAIKDVAEGKFVIVVDDEDRENEGDLIIAAEKITPEKVNFMLKHARGLLCAPITISRCHELDLPRQVSENTSMLGTPFTITIDKLEGCSTGVSAHDRCETIRALAGPHQPALCPGPRRAATQRPHRGHHRPVPSGRSISRRRPDGDHERRRYHGAPSPASQDGPRVRPETHHHTRPHRLPPAEGVAHRGGHRGRHAHPLRPLPPYPLQADQHRPGALCPNQG